VGLAFGFVPVTIAALAQVSPQEAGLASGLINTNQQIGGAIGVALASTIFTSHAKTLLKSGHSPAEAFTSGYQLAFWALVGIALAGAVAGFVLLRGTKAPVAEAEAAPAAM
jgi:MFS family permease